jgi:signal transduction histidine kinase
MPISLRLKLFVLVAGAALFATTGVTAVAIWREVVRGQELLSREGAAIAASVAGAANRWVRADSSVPGAREALMAPLERVLEAAPLQSAWVVDRSGQVLACADRTQNGCRPGVPTEFELTEGPLTAIRRLVHPAPLEAQAPIIGADGVLVGVVRVSFWPDEVVGTARRLAAGAAAVAILWLALSYVAAGILVQRFTRPLTELVSASVKLGEGESVEIQAKGDAEVDELLGAFNRLSARLRERREEKAKLIASLNQRIEEATRDVLRADRLATMGGIAAGFAHELGNSLHVIGGYASVVQRDLPAEHANRADIDAIKRETSRAGAMLHRFLFFARARTVRTELQPIEPILREAVEVVGPAAAQAKVTTRVECAPGLSLVRADAELLRQAFLNLCVNAVEAMKEKGGQLAVTARNEGDEVWVDFQDTGPGVPKDEQERVFEAFFTTKATGTGLGLAIVRHAAEAHAGSVEVSSEPGQGARFRIRLPAGKEQA